MIHEIDSKWTVAFYASCNRIYVKMLVGFCVITVKLFFCRGFILKPAERLKFHVKSGTKDFKTGFHLRDRDIFM